MSRFPATGESIHAQAKWLIEALNSRGEPLSIQPGIVSPAPVGMGYPLTIEIAHIYTGRFPRRESNKQVLVTSALKNVPSISEAPRAIQLLRPVGHYQHPEFGGYLGTPLVYYKPAVDHYTLTGTLMMSFDEFPKEVTDQIAGLLTSAAALPMFAAGRIAFVVGGLATRLIGELGERLYDNVADFAADFKITFDPEFPAVQRTYILTDSRYPIDLDQFAVDDDTPEFFLSSKTSPRKTYDGDSPYVVLRIHGQERPEYASFVPALASGDSLRGFELQDGKTISIQPIIEAMEAINDTRYQREALKWETVMAGLQPDSPEYQIAQKRMATALKNILDDALRQQLAQRSEPMPALTGRASLASEHKPNGAPVHRAKQQPA